MHTVLYCAEFRRRGQDHATIRQAGVRIALRAAAQSSVVSLATGGE